MHGHKAVNIDVMQFVPCCHGGCQSREPPQQIERASFGGHSLHMRRETFNKGSGRAVMATVTKQICTLEMTPSLSNVFFFFYSIFGV